MKKTKEIVRDLTLLETIEKALEQYHMPPEWVDETIYSYIADLVHRNNISYEKARLILAVDIKAGIYEHVLVSPTRIVFYYTDNCADVVGDSWLCRYENRHIESDASIKEFLRNSYVLL